MKHLGSFRHGGALEASPHFEIFAKRDALSSPSKVSTDLIAQNGIEATKASRA